MKTSELKKIIEDSGCSFTDDKYCNTYLINFKNHKQYQNNLVACVGKKDNYTVINSVCPRVLAHAIVDYAYTPLEEREEDIRYIPNLYGDIFALMEINKKTITEKELVEYNGIEKIGDSWYLKLTINEEAK